MRIYSVSKGINNLVKIDNTDSIAEIKKKALDNEGSIYEADIYNGDGDYVNTVTKCDWVQNEAERTRDEEIFR